MERESTSEGGREREGEGLRDGVDRPGGQEDACRKVGRKISHHVTVICPRFPPSLSSPLSLFNWSIPFLCWLAIVVLFGATLVFFFIPLRYVILIWGQWIGGEEERGGREGGEEGRESE